MNMKSFQLTDEQIQQQDLVDNLIFELIKELHPSENCMVDWDIEKIGAIRDVLISCYPEIEYPGIDIHGERKRIRFVAEVVEKP